MKWDIVFYETARGDRPAQLFIDKQNTATRAKIERHFDLLILNGPDLGMPFARYFGKGLYELRIRARNEVRIFYLQADGTRIIMLHAFRKRTQKTPSRELKLARQRQNGLTET